jgi:putative lipoic acid-binding regulatory protein
VSGEPPEAYPAEYTFKIFGRRSPTFVERVSTIVAETFGELSPDSVSVRTSSGQKYLSVTIVVWVADRSQLEKVYTELKAEPEVLLYI